MNKSKVGFYIYIHFLSTFYFMNVVCVFIMIKKRQVENYKGLKIDVFSKPFNLKKSNKKENQKIHYNKIKV